jgi:hypothetical protein
VQFHDQLVYTLFGYPEMVDKVAPAGWTDQGIQEPLCSSPDPIAAAALPVLDDLELTVPPTSRDLPNTIGGSLDETQSRQGVEGTLGFREVQSRRDRYLVLGTEPLADGVEAGEL